MYTKPVTEIILDHNLNAHCYADDTLIYFSFKSEVEFYSNFENLRLCISDISEWMRANSLKLNHEKTDIILIGTQDNDRLIDSFTIGNNSVSVSNEVKYLGAIIDHKVTLEGHINSVCRVCFIKIHQLWKIRRYLDFETTKTLVHTAIISRLDHINGILAGLPIKTTKKLQRVLNGAARLIFRQPKRTNTTPLLQQLHWLPVRCRIKHKVLTLVYKCINGTGPQYLCDLLRPYRVDRENLRSGNQQLLEVPYPENRYSSRAFSYYGPKHWNQLPPNVRSATSVKLFRKRLKTHLFYRYFILGERD